MPIYFTFKFSDFKILNIVCVNFLVKFNKTPTIKMPIINSSSINDIS